MQMSQEWPFQEYGIAATKTLDRAIAEQWQMHLGITMY